MGNVIRSLCLVLLLFMSAFAPFSVGTSANAAESEEGILVGRIAHVEGKLLRYIEEEKDWVVTVKDSPFGLEDALYSDEDARAEFIMPNKTWLRIGENTHIQLIDLNPDATTVDVGSGVVRLYNKGEQAVIKATTPYGYVVASGNSAFDLYVGDESLEVIAIRGTVDFVHERSDARFQVRSGSFSIIADHSETARGNGTVESAWDDWNGQRDSVWHKRLRGKNYSAGYLPEPIRDEGYILDETGRWERVYYEGEYRQMWRPLRVERSWRPFTAGRWTVYYGDHCWIPDEPFGYVTHHYGSWVYVEARHCWYWTPPVMRIAASAPRFSVSFGWYPGRVSWIHRGTFIGWVPLAPHERYYCYRPWGYHSVVVNPSVSLKVGVSVNLFNLSFINQATIIHRDNFYRGTRYTPFLERNIGRDVIINNYQPVTVINNTVINNFSSDTRRFAYNDMEVLRKPHSTVVNRISENQKIKREFGSFNRKAIENDLTRFSAAGEPMALKESRRPSLSNKLVEADKVNKPLDSLSLTRKEIKGQDRGRHVVDDRDLKSSAADLRGGGDEERGKKLRSPREQKSSEDQFGRQQEGKKGGKELGSFDSPGGEKGKGGGKKGSFEATDGEKSKGGQKHGRTLDSQDAEKGKGRKQEAMSQKEESVKGQASESKSQKRETKVPSGDKGSRKQDQSAIDRGGKGDRGGKDRHEDTARVQSRESREKVKDQPNRQQDQVRQVERKSPRQEQKVESRQRDENQVQRKQGKPRQQQEEVQVAQEQPQHQKRGKKNE
ncbi:MAG: hypothetical protein A2X81_14200 [Desulfobacterales bacterium GWB2_56_26]|nr:MAG: hypothetical protein A2X81_14200 [Desulfobacterales bacterium GWB2_56_26]